MNTETVAQAESRRFYVTMTWDDWPEGGSFGTVVEAMDHADAEKLCREEMAATRAEESWDNDDDESEEKATARILESYEGDWHVVDCFPLDDFITRHRDGAPVRDHWGENPEFPISDWQSEVANGDTRLGYHDWLAARGAQV